MRVRHPWESARRSAASLVLITGVLAVACAPAAPVSPAATAAPAKPAAAPAASPGASPAASPGAAVAPATAAGAVAQVQPKGAIAIVLESDGDTINPKDGSTDNAYFVMYNVYDHLTTREWSGGTSKIVGQLAESWEQSQSDPKTWRFKLRPGLKFINGEPINADAVVNIVSLVTNKDKPGLSIDEYGLGGGATATKVDEYTVDITTGGVDAIYPARAAKMPIPAPKWLATMPNDASITQAVGSGPYQLTEFAKGTISCSRLTQTTGGRISRPSARSRFSSATKPRCGPAWSRRARSSWPPC
jgi:ABC-type transport system substrate-binding protein